MAPSSPPSKRPLGLSRDTRPSPVGNAPGGAQLSHLEAIIACEERLEEAIHFLVQSLAQSPRNGKKPVVLHSIRVAYKLLTMGYGLDVVLAGLLHDVLEKTIIAEAQIARRFGTEVALMVRATTNDTRLDCPINRYHDSLKRCSTYGEGALLVRAADLNDNCDRLLTLGSVARLGRIADKIRMVIKVCREELVDPRMVDELSRRLRRINRKAACLALVPKRHPTTVKAARHR